MSSSGSDEEEEDGRGYELGLRSSGSCVQESEKV